MPDNNETAMEKEDVMEAEQIADELRKLIEREKKEGEPGEEQDLQHLEDAVASMEKFLENENKEVEEESSESPEEKSSEHSGTVDTSVLTGPISGLKNFLIKKSRDNEASSNTMGGGY